MHLPAEEPAQEGAPAVDEAAYFDLVPVAPMHTFAEASPGSASETVVGAEHAAAVVPYPYDLQPVQDAPAEPVAESSVPEERAEVPRPRQWADEGGWDSRAVFMPVSEVVSAAATIAIPMHACNPHGSSAALRAALMRLGVPRNAKALVCAGSEGGESGVRVQRHCTDTGWSPRRAGCARGGQRVRSFQCRTLISRIAVGTNTRPNLLEFAPAGGAASRPRRERVCARTGRVAACEKVRCVRDVPRTRTVRLAAVLTRLRGVSHAHLPIFLRRGSHSLIRSRLFGCRCYK
ncbi:hypothetical protein FB451DRAFT_1568679 [Mycena latifolia]|nr:hypothetical protein FB451DRAFT_1568679 [Mycena latifolia]